MKFMNNYQASGQDQAQRSLINETKTNVQIVILAAGKGSRMKSDVPKVLQLVGGRAMIDRVFDSAKQVTGSIIVVCSPLLESYVKSNFIDNAVKDTARKRGRSLANASGLIKLALQTNPLGTAHAVYSAIDVIDASKLTVVLYADNPFITPEIIQKLLRHLVSTDSSLVTLAFNHQNPAQYGRIVTSEDGEFLKIVEFKDASESERAVTLCNSGVMVFAPNILNQYLPLCLRGSDFAPGSLKDTNQHNADYKSKEFYLTDMVEICKNNNHKVSYFIAPNSTLVMGVNTPEELDYANSQNSIPNLFL